MRTIAKLFGKSPFAQLQTHMDKVAECINQIHDLFEALRKEEYEEIDNIVAKLSKLEHSADLIKNEIRNTLPKGLFLQIDRGNVLEILSLQDDLADAAEDVGVLLTLYPLKMIDVLDQEFTLFLSKNIETFNGTRSIIHNLDELVEFTFGGIEAEKVLELIDNVAYCEHEVDIMQRSLLKKLFANEDKFTTASMHLWLRIFDSVASISNLSETLANRIRMTLELK